MKAHNPCNIVFEDAHLVVIDKPAGLLTIATEHEKTLTAYHALSMHVKKAHRANKIFIVHRLDRDTSGLLVFAKSAQVQRLLQDQWDTMVSERSYVAVVEGQLQKPEDTIVSYLHENKAFVVYSNQDPKGGKKAITHYKVLRSLGPYSMLEVHLETGRKNQIRVHLQSIGHPIVNDKKYGARTNPFGRLGLHAQALSFTHPITRETLHFKARTPKKFQLLFCKGHQKS
ncbi:RluA family pseudouridine synthase [Geofilum rhodophaeum]|uniref:RluA family pseudouridine synthase n=1 Tax=Geofilum rhodophaeum TaxID=1965019 RepID=UPI000B522CBA|nr:RNA pseudouridine synthase [Geofilum rhodophaeum]